MSESPSGPTEPRENAAAAPAPERDAEQKPKPGWAAGFFRARNLAPYTIRLLDWAFVGVVCFVAVIGMLFITRGTAVRRVQGVGADTIPVAPSDSTFPLAVELLTGAPLDPGNSVELVLDGAVYPRLWADLHSARTSITVQMYYAEPGKVADSLAAILTERARAGVRVYVLYDAFGASPLGGKYAARLRAAGVRIVAFRPLRFANLWVIQNRSHVRGVVIDARIGWTGGFGIDDKWLGDGRAGTGWRDTNVRFEGPAALQLLGTFAAGWAEATGELYTGRGFRVPQSNGIMAGLLYTAPTLGSTPAERYLALSIAGARHRMFITNAYFAPDSNFVALLTHAARRGVDVRLLVGGPSTDVAVARQAAHRRYDALLGAGVRIYEYVPTTLHAKTFVIDGIWTSVGTMNFDNRSLALNDESTLMVRDTAFGRKMEEMFEEDVRHARQVDAAQFRKRPWFEHLVEWGANLITRVL